MVCQKQVEQFKLCRGQIDGIAVNGGSLLVEVQAQTMIAEQMLTQTGFNDIHDIVADFLAVSNDVVIESAESIGILM